MKILMKNHAIAILVLLGFLVIVPQHASAKNSSCIDLGKRDAPVREALKKYNGDYLSKSFLEKTLQTRDVFTGRNDKPPPAIFINSEKTYIVEATSWHESWPLLEDADGDGDGDGDNEACLSVKDNDLLEYSYPEGTETYQKLPFGSTIEGYLRRALFNGCYLDEKQLSFCFEDGNIRFKGGLLHAELKLDSSELAAEGNYLAVQGEDLFWVFVPIPNGWKVYKSDWASAENYKPINLAKPWKILTKE